MVLSPAGLLSLPTSGGLSVTGDTHVVNITSTGVSNLTGDTALKGSGYIGEIVGGSISYSNINSFRNELVFTAYSGDKLLVTTSIPSGFWLVCWSVSFTVGVPLSAAKIYLSNAGGDITIRYFVSSTTGEHYVCSGNTIFQNKSGISQVIELRSDFGANPFDGYAEISFLRIA